MTKKLILFLTLFSIIKLSANNIAVSNVSITDQNTVDNYVFIQFDLSWDHSWHDGVNWDAAWVFIKYKLESGSTWNQAYLSLNNLDHSVTNDNSVSAAFIIGSSITLGINSGIGCFIYREDQVAEGGSNNWQGVKLRWNYGENGLADNDQVTVKVFAIEMVNIPGGSFYVGDGTINNIRGQFHDAANTSSPFQIINESSLTLGGTSAGDLGNNNQTGMNPAGLDDFSSTTSKSLSASFPKGSNPFYIMKYELTQKQYVDFLNCLTYNQQIKRVYAPLNSPSGSAALKHTDGVNPSNLNNEYRNGIDIEVPGVSPSQPAVFSCNFDNDLIFNESNDGFHIPCNMLNWMDAAAYADWAGLRGITDLEFEKAARGPGVPIADEYPWGSDLIFAPDYEFPSANNGTALENVSGTSPFSVINDIGNSLNSGTSANTSGPHRSGMFASNSLNTIDFKVRSGGSFYGVMEMGGNLWEPCITVGNEAGRSYIGMHGNGSININGDADVDFYPGINGNTDKNASNTVYGGSTGVTSSVGIGYRGGGRSFSAYQCRISSREFAGVKQDLRHRDDGVRLVRTVQ